MLISTGITAYDRVLDGGLRCGRLHLLYGAAATGKTTLVCHMARRLAARLCDDQ